ncbi:GFA family protein [Ochrobactrum sp. CM-21-5]|nr:GFA family protein [Ochrobactrum sp. CM-21-5]MBC2883928.1 GFA family protein [Ochrobactrum sp. CM-21-5]
MNPDIKEANGACHCGTVRFHVKLADGLHSARRCTCSYCRMRGAIAVSADLDGLKILEGEEALSLYTFNTGVAKHFFCSKCGIYTHHQRRSNPRQFGVNAACLEGISPFDFKVVPVNDGMTHPADDPQHRGSRIVGYYQYKEVSTFIKE